MLCSFDQLGGVLDDHGLQPGADVTARLTLPGERGTMIAARLRGVRPLPLDELTAFLASLATGDAAARPWAKPVKLFKRG